MTKKSGNQYENCPKVRFHKLKVIASPYTSKTDKQQVEQCQECGEILVFDFDANGNMPNERGYFLAHIRDFAQPIKQDAEMFEVFMFCNPKLAAKIEQEAKEAAKDKDWHAEMSEMFRHALASAAKDKDWQYKDSRGEDRSSKNLRLKKIL